MSLVVDLPPVKILYIPSENGISGAEEAFTKLESSLPTLKNRKFYGLVFGAPPHETYWACVAFTRSDSAISGCKIGEIPGGKYVQERIYNWEKNIDALGKTFKRLTDENTIDSSRPCVEYYHGMNYMIVRIPI